MTTKTPDSRRELRQALGNFGTGVTIVTTLSAGGQPVGMTANSFNSVSLDPPIVLWSLLKTSPSLQAFDDCGRFVIHVLTLAQLALSKRFATSLPDKFAGVGWQAGLAGLPVIDDCASVFQCRTVQRLEVGDHILFLGEIEAYHHHIDRDTLLFCRGQYAQSQRLEAATS
jgi:flavin reductase (DIM6/NTAB) family NADH-FMN oxidoreductase RutF